jgi:alkylation response protein AidB-like acyl-CoA dehydrogenase
MIPFLSEEQLELRHQVRRFLAATSALPEVRRLMSTQTGYDLQVWRQMADQLELQSLGICDEFGGSGRTYVELCLVIEEMGYALVGSPYLSCAIAACALQSADNPQATGGWSSQIASGRCLATLCIADDRGSWSAAGNLVATASDDAGWVLNGYTAYVMDGQAADLLVAVASVDGAPALFVVDASSQPGVRACGQPTLDETRKLARIEFSRCPARLVSSLRAQTLVDHVLDIAVVLLAAESLGGARRCLDMSVDYAKNRVQFGRPIGSFQAIKHKCADMLVQVEAARSIIFYASRLAGSEAEADRQELGVVASLAKAYCTDAFFHAAGECLQIHGGIGFTWEHDAHLFFKRASSSRLMFGNPAEHREQVAQRLGLSNAASPTAS